MTRSRLAVVLSASVCAAHLGACASLPESVDARDISTERYADYDCGQVRQEMARVNEETRKMAGVQGRLAAQDLVVFGAAVTTFWPAIFLLAGDAKEGELAALKGQQVALERVAIENHCPVAEDLARAREGS